MRLKLLGDPKAPDLLIFFNGWAMDERPFVSLWPQGMRIAMLFDYRDLTLPELPSVRGRTLVLAWSLGVYAALYHLEILPSRIVFLAGTGVFKDRLYGIDPRVLDLTLAALKEKGYPVLERFYRRMFAKEDSYRRFWANPPQRELAEVIEELEAAGSFPALFPEIPPEARVLIPEKDDIIPCSAQERFWEKAKGSFVRFPEGHFPFYARRDLLAWFHDVP